LVGGVAVIKFRLQLQESSKLIKYPMLIWQIDQNVYNCSMKKGTCGSVADPDPFDTDPDNVFSL
jgi:hypothetical protein